MQSTIFNQSSTLVFQPESTGIVQCMAINAMGNAKAGANLIVNDLDEDLSIWSENDPPIAIGDEVSIMCGASAHKYANELNWYKDNVLIQSGNGKLNLEMNFPNIFSFQFIFFLQVCK